MLAHSLIVEYLLQFGPIFLFFALMLGIVGLPIPDETLLVSAGYLAAHHQINLPVTVIFAWLGSMSGITISYLLGRLVGKWVIKRYGPTLNLTQENIARVHLWFAKIGKWVLTIGYFIPLFRHIVGFVAGGAKLEYHLFALYAYSGAIIWSSTFLAIGYYMHPFFSSLVHKT